MQKRADSLFTVRRHFLGDTYLTRGTKRKKIVNKHENNIKLYKTLFYSYLQKLVVAFLSRVDTSNKT